MYAKLKMNANYSQSGEEQIKLDSPNVEKFLQDVEVISFSLHVYNEYLNTCSFFIHLLNRHVALYYMYVYKGHNTCITLVKESAYFFWM